jgi:hypothetical protein
MDKTYARLPCMYRLEPGKVLNLYKPYNLNGYEVEATQRAK